MNESGFIPISVIGEEIFKDFGKEQQKAKIKDNILKRYGIEKVDEELNGRIDMDRQDQNLPF